MKRSLPTWMKGASERQQADTSGDVRTVTPALPMMSYTGHIVYCYHHGECSLICEDIRKTLGDGDIVAGMDMEWSVTFTAGNQSKTATIQLCLSTDPNTSYLFHLAAMTEYPKALTHLLADKRLKKVGLNITGDIWKLGRDFEFPAKEVLKESVFELKTLANSVLKSDERWSLNGLSQHLFHQQLDKNSEIRQGQWDAYPLPDTCQKYAALDAQVSLKLYQELITRSNSR